MKIVANVKEKGLVEVTLKALGFWAGRSFHSLLAHAAGQDLAPRPLPIDLSHPPVPETEREAWWDDMPGED